MGIGVKVRIGVLWTMLASVGLVMGEAPAGPPSSSPGHEKWSPRMRAVVDDETGPYRVWVFFRDKGLESPEAVRRAVQRVAENYNPRALERRRLRGLNARRGGALCDLRDVPVCARYRAAVQDVGCRIRRESRWLNAISVEASEAQLQAISALDCVAKIQPMARTKRPEPVGQRPLEPHSTQARSSKRSLDYGAAFAQLNQIDVIALHDAGYTGAGVIIGILDTGFKRTHEAFNQPGHEVDVIAEYDFVDDDPIAAPETGDPSGQHDHGTYILGTIGAYMPGALIGGAFDARFVLAKTEDTTGEYPEEEDNYVAGLEFIEANGADMTTSSLGYIDWYTQPDLNGETAVTTIAVNTAGENGLHMCTAAGNEYHDADPTTSHLIAPADAFKVITCGAVTSSGSITGFSSDGPTADGRVKPEVLARGSSTSTVSPSSDTGYTSVDGTSLSTPLVAGAVACLIQAHPEWTVDELREALFLTSDYYVEHRTHDPQFVRGYGIIDAFAAIQDCNENDIPDILEIADGTAQDCQGNGIIDACEFEAGTAQDCNLNGVPDACDIAPPELGLVDDRDPVLGFEEIAGVGVALGLSDDGETTVSMPFTNTVFPIDSVQVGNNGGVGFGGSENLTYTNGGIPADVFGGVQALLPFWDDIDSDTGDVYVHTLGTQPDRTFIVEWKDRPHYSGDTLLNGDETTFQIQIFETPIDGVHAQYVYLDTDFLDPDFDFGASATVGYQDDANDGFMWSQDDAVIPSGTILSLVYIGEPVSQDLNGNGIPDECEGATCPGDLNFDFHVDLVDLGLAESLWRQASPSADLNGSGWVEVRDLVWMTSAFGPCP